ncbi:hypothetical protein ACGF12_35840 [Kitasatospora sp. NPDC048296]|uniref:hypothetical protein n=1 Tax=Kitasatospora sp. NPDC048296 TaxID=3364048 RepID=UPI0037201352
MGALTTFEKIGMGIVGVALITTLVLPQRQTPQVISSLFNGLSSWTGTAMGQSQYGG